eukprot:SAG11_NODE_32_length_22830_cov_17.507941_12_plen_152_part_00
MNMHDACTEDDLFVFRAADPNMIRRFLKIMHQLGVLKQFKDEVAATSTQQFSTGKRQSKHDKLVLSQSRSSLASIQRKYLHPDAEVQSDSQWTGPVLQIFEVLLGELIISTESDMLERNGLVNAELQVCPCPRSFMKVSSSRILWQCTVNV